MLKDCIQKLIRKEDLSSVDIESVLKEILSGVNEAQIAAFLVLLSAKGETVEEIYGLAKTMRSMMIKVKAPYPLLDIVGTGGDGFNTVNISTGSAILAASCGVRIAKHGNRSVSSLSGSADVLESLGVNIDISPSDITESIQNNNFGFCYAPNFHTALGAIKHIRKKLGVPTVFNLLGPLLNPAQAQFLMIGVANQSYIKLISDVLLKLGVERALIFNCSGLDEICCVGPIKVIEIINSKTHDYSLEPTNYGFKQCKIEDLQGGGAQTNAEIIKKSLKGHSGPVSDTLILNAGLANYIYGLRDTIQKGIDLAKEKHRNGDAYKLLEQLVIKTNRLPKFSGVRYA